MTDYNEFRKKAETMKDGDMADYFIRAFEYDKIIPEVFNFYYLDCIDRCKINQAELDLLVKEFDKRELNRYEVLTDIIHMLRNAGKPEKTNDRLLFDSVRAYIDEHLYENLSVEQMAEELNVSYYYMCHLFKKNTDETISGYRNRKRVLRAEALLAQTDKKIVDIAAECGYDNASYFTSVFTKITGESPVKFRNEHMNTVYQPFFYENDVRLASMLPYVKLLGEVKEIPKESCRTLYKIHMPDEFRFLHEAAVIEYKGVIFTAWYNCPETELKGRTPIRGRRSYDGGATWTEPEIIIDDPSGDIMYCPPVYGISDGKLYMLLNEMVAPDHIHALVLFVFDEEADKFVKVWSRPIPFKLNTNVYKLPNGKLVLPGRCGELDRFPNTPAVLISDSGKIDGEWRMVKVAENGILPDGESYVHPETNLFYAEDKLYMLCRNDLRLVPILYISEDYGETWSEPYAYDMPMINSKMYSENLSDGRHYVIGNTYFKDRSQLVIYFTEDESAVFTKKVVLHDGPEETFPRASGYHYPVAYEYNNKLYIIYTVNLSEGWFDGRGAAMSIIDLDKI